MNVRVKLFASAREAAGVPEIEISTPSEATIAEADQALRRQCPSLARLSGRWAVNLEFVSGGHRISPGDEVAFIPPVSGG